MSEVELIRAAALAAIPHAFLGRRGGVSTGVLAGLNVGYGSSDDRDAIDENRRRAIGAVFPAAELATVHQVHSATVVYVERPWPQGERPEADAMVTDRPNLLLGILTADCAPVLFADARARVIGAAHAGWKGAVGGVLEATIAAMEGLGARRGDIMEGLSKLAFESYPGERPRFALEAYLAGRLESAGIGAFDALGLDTYADPERFYSYRRATHRGEPDYGRQVSLIGLPAKSA